MYGELFKIHIVLEERVKLVLLHKNWYKYEYLVYFFTKETETFSSRQEQKYFSSRLD